MATPLQIIKGSYEGDWELHGDANKFHMTKGSRRVELSDILVSVEKIDENRLARSGADLATGTIAGGLLLGPIGAVVGGWMGTSKYTTFVATLKNGDKFVARITSNYYGHLVSATI